MNDINKTPKKSLRDIFPESHVLTSEINSQPTGEPVITQYCPPQGSRINLSPVKKVSLIALILVIVLSGGYFVSKTFSKVTVKVTPKQGRLLVNNIFDASKEDGSDLRFVLASEVEDEAKTTISASGKEFAKDKASGQLTIYNNYSTQAQALIKDTRFQSSAGLIYRINDRIVVPGMTKNAKGETVPGQVTVTVTADQAGPSYNIAQTDFTIPGFKGSAKYTKFYARSKTAFTGGFEGERAKVSPADKAKAENDLKNKLTADLIKKLSAQIPDDYILFDDAVIAAFYPGATKFLPAGDKAEISLQIKATGILLDKKELSQFLAQKQIPNYQGEDITITNWPEMKFSLIDKDKIDLNNLKEISFKLEGNGHLVWAYNEQELRQKLQLANAGNYRQIFDKYFPTVQMASIVFSPPWVRSVPTDQKRIKVETIISQP